MLIALAFIVFIAMIASWLVVPEKSTSVASAPSMAAVGAAAD